jgi:arylsulfatase A-like enzyme
MHGRELDRSRRAGEWWVRRLRLGLVLALAYFTTATGVSAAERPNFVVILADDMGFSDIGSFGGEIATPRLDRLADGGLRFTNFYNTARCSPTRASLLTGVYPHEAGMGWLSDHDWGAPGYSANLRGDVATLPETLAKVGYRSYMSGKWHLVEDRDDPTLPGPEGAPPSWPRSRGFDRWYGTSAGAGSYFAPRHLFRDDEPITVEDPDYYYTDAISSAGVRFVREHARDHPDSPFFLYLAYTAPHWPLHARPEDIERYRGRYDVGWDRVRQERHARMIELGILPPDTKLTPRDPGVPAWQDAENREWEARRMEVYAAQVDRMDQGIGQVVDALSEIGALDNTLILFLSDNGGSSEEVMAIQGWSSGATQRGNDPSFMPGGRATFSSYGLPWANVSNTPFRLYKHFVHEGGVATPLIAHWPAGIGAATGALSESPGHVVDIMPTLLELAGAEPLERLHGREVRSISGKSLVPVLSGQDFERGPIFFEHEGNRAVRHGRWKRVARTEASNTGALDSSLLSNPGRWELYDLERDRTELHDVAGTVGSELEAELALIWQIWAVDSRVEPWPHVIIRGLALDVLPIVGGIILGSGAVIFGMRLVRRVRSGRKS